MAVEKQDTKALPERPNPAAPDSGEPGDGKGRVDRTGIMPDNIRVDPDITEGHPGYQESGDSALGPGSATKEPRTK